MNRNNYVCFACRRGFKHGGAEGEVRCPQCGQAVSDMGKYFKVPPRHAAQQRRKVALLADAGVRFDSSQRSWLPERPVKTYAQAKRVEKLSRARHDTAIAGSAQAPAGSTPHAQRGLHKTLSQTIKRNGSARRALREARAARALALIQGDSNRIGSVERQIARLVHHVDTLERQRQRERR